MSLGRGLGTLQEAISQKPSGMLEVTRIVTVQAVEMRSVRLLELLEREYRPSLLQDRELLGLLEIVKQKHFGGQRGGLGGLLGSLFQNLGPHQSVATA